MWWPFTKSWCTLHTCTIVVESNPSNESFAPPSTDLQLQSLSLSSATSPTNQDRLNRDNTTLEEELSSSLAQLNLREGSGSVQEETQFTKRHDYIQKSEGLREPIVDSGKQRSTGVHHYEEKQKIEVANSEGKRDNGIVEDDHVQRTEQYSSGLNGSEKLMVISEEEEETDKEVLEWRISDVFSGLDNDSPKN